MARHGRGAMRGTPLRELRGPEGEVDVRLAFRDSDRQSVETWRGCRCTRPRPAHHARLGRELRVTRGAAPIERVDRTTAAVITANLDGATMDDIKQRVEALS